MLVPDNLPQLVEQTESAALALTELACKLDGVPEVPQSVGQLKTAVQEIPFACLRS